MSQVALQVPEIPEKYLGQPPRELEAREEYYHFWITRTQLPTTTHQKRNAGFSEL